MISFDLIFQLLEMKEPGVVNKKAQQLSKRNGLRVDYWSRVMFPLMFLLFNIIYWPYYTMYYE